MRWEERWPNFTPEEVLSPSGLILWRRRSILQVQPHMLDFLQNYRNHWDKPFLINHGGLKYRGYRSCGENKEAGGTVHSFHLQGLAVDVTIPGVEPSHLFEDAVNFGWTGVGLYAAKNFVHLDLRPSLSPGTAIWHG